MVTFLLVSTGSVFGYSWCLGDDGHVEVSYARGSGCCDVDLQARHTRATVSNVSSKRAETCGSCLDFSVQQGDAVFFKRVKRSSMPAVATLSASVFSPGLTRDPLQVAPLASFAPRLSQTILAHRTVVLLH